jgi:hypothetical protein
MATAFASLCLPAQPLLWDGCRSRLPQAHVARAATAVARACTAYKNASPRATRNAVVSSAVVGRVFAVPMACSSCATILAAGPDAV